MHDKKDANEVEFVIRSPCLSNCSVNLQSEVVLWCKFRFRIAEAMIETPSINFARKGVQTRVFVMASI